MQYAFPAGRATGDQMQRFTIHNVGQHRPIESKPFGRGYHQQFPYIRPPGKQGHRPLENRGSANVRKEFIATAKPAASTGCGKYHTKTIFYHALIVCPKRGGGTI